MITQKDLKSYEFECLEDYFCYIIESKVNGNFSQVRKLIQDLSKEQHKEFVSYCIENALANDNEQARHYKELALLSI